MVRRILPVMIVASLAWSVTQADPPSDQNALAPADMIKMMKAGDKPDGKKDKSPFPKFKKVTKDMESKKGLFTLWSYPASAKDKDTEKLLCQIPAGFLGEKFMLSTSFSGGGFSGHYVFNELVDLTSLPVSISKGTTSNSKSFSYLNMGRGLVNVSVFG